MLLNLLPPPLRVRPPETGCGNVVCIDHGCELLSQNNQFDGHGSHLIFSDPANNFFSIYRIFWQECWEIKNRIDYFGTVVNELQ